MENLRNQITRPMTHKWLGETTGAIAGFSGAISVVVGSIAEAMAPRGLARFTVALHLAREPLIVRLAPIVAGIALVVATAAGFLRFYSWWVERRGSDCRQGMDPHPD